MNVGGQGQALPLQLCRAVWVINFGLRETCVGRAASKAVRRRQGRAAIIVRARGAWQQGRRDFRGQFVLEHKASKTRRRRRRGSAEGYDCTSLRAPSAPSAPAAVNPSSNRLRNE